MHAIAPYVAIANPDGAVSIQNFIQNNATINIVATFNAVRTALPKMGLCWSPVLEQFAFGDVTVSNVGIVATREPAVLGVG